MKHFSHVVLAAALFTFGCAPGEKQADQQSQAGGKSFAASDAASEKEKEFGRLDDLGGMRSFSTGSNGDAAGNRPASSAPKISRDVKQQKIRADRAKLKGRWRIVKAEVGGETQPDLLTSESLLIFSGDSLTKYLGGGNARQAQFHIDPTKNPPQLDVIERKNGKPRVTKGIYSLKGGRLILCMNESANLVRPKEFSTKAGDGRSLMLLERAK